MTQFIFSNANLPNQFIQLNANGSMLLHVLISAHRWVASSFSKKQSTFVNKYSIICTYTLHSFTIRKDAIKSSGIKLILGEHKMKKNILNFKLYKIFFLTMLIDPIFVIYAYSCGLSVSEIFILSSIETLLIVLLEIPTGIVADLFGCKISIIWGIISFICSNIIVLLYPKFLGFLICSTLIAFYKVLISGAD